jgi:hypothetical protein
MFANWTDDAVLTDNYPSSDLTIFTNAGNTYSVFKFTANGVFYAPKFYLGAYSSAQALPPQFPGVMYYNTVSKSISLWDGVGTTQASGAGVQLSSGASSWGSFSDERLKNVTGTYTTPLADIAKLRPVKFTWKSDVDNKPQVGLIAQSVQDVVPEAVDAGTYVKGEETEYLMVRYTELVPLLVASIQELKAEFDAYKSTHP